MILHRTPKKFQVVGTIEDDSRFIQSKETMTHYLICEMRDKGYIPVLGYGPMFTTSRLEDGGYDFTLTAFGVYVGKGRSERLEGIDGHGHTYPRNIPATADSARSEVP